MARDEGKAVGQHLRELLARSHAHSAGSELMAESVGATRDFAEAAVEDYVPANVPHGFSVDEVAQVARKAVTEEPLSPREGLIAEAIILPDLRPAVDVVGGDFDIDHPLWRDYETGQPAHEAFREKIPSVGRVELPGSPYPYGGTCFVVGDNLVMTNRHVAQLFASGLGSKGLDFLPGAKPGVDFLQEAGGPAGKTIAFRRMRMIHPYWDLALIEVEGLEGHPPLVLDPVEPDSAHPRRIAVIGYPAFDPRNSVEVQNQVFRGLYNVKRFQPGLFNGRRNVESFGKSVSAGCHDSSTLGGNSGSVVLESKNGHVVGLHFAGIYKDSNFAVAAVDLAKDGRIIDAGVKIVGGGRRASGAWDNWWSRTGSTEEPKPAPPPPAPPSAPSPAPGGTVSVTVPLTITIALGQPGTAGAAALPAESLSLDSAVAQMTQSPPEGVLRVKPGFNGRTDCIVLAADPDRFPEVLEAAPASFAGHPVEVRYATIEEQLGLSTESTEAPGTIAYDDSRRTGPDFAFDPVDEKMTVIAHVGPEESFHVLQDFLGKAKHSLTSSMYQFFAGHVKDAVEERLENGVTMSLVLDPATRDPNANPPKPGEFDRSATFENWRRTFDFRNIFIRKGNGGLVDSAYHIKVTVRDRGAKDGDWIWLSSGNWTRSSQPAPDPQTRQARGNREWHIVARSARLARMFAAHIDADFEQSQELGGSEEAPAPVETLVDVPEPLLLEVPVQLLKPLEIDRKVKVQPILTPDKHGRVYTDAVLALIRSATDQLVFQNQYIKIRRTTGGNLAELVDALIERSKAIPDVRIVLRAGDVDDDIAELRRRGMDVAKCVRTIANTHTKGIVADRRRVLIGSQNWSEQAVATNRDASLLFDDAEIARYFLEAFEIDWGRARPIAASITELPVLPARGPAPPPGYVRMTLSEYRSG